MVLSTSNRVEHVSNFVLKDSMFQGQGSNRIAPIAWFNEQRSRECKSTETVDGHHVRNCVATLKLLMDNSNINLDTLKTPPCAAS